MGTIAVSSGTMRDIRGPEYAVSFRLSASDSAERRIIVVENQSVVLHATRSTRHRIREGSQRSVLRSVSISSGSYPPNRIAVVVDIVDIMRLWLRVLITVFVLGSLILLLIFPVPAKPLIYHAFHSPMYELRDSDADTTVELRNDYAIYRAANGKRQNERLIVVLIGGAFLFNHLRTHYGFSNLLHERMRRDGYDLMVVRYPVRFRSTMRDMMLSLNKSLSDVLRYRVCHAIGFSAGALLAGTFIRKEAEKEYAEKIRVPQIGLRFDSFVGLCGLYEPTFDVQLFTRLFTFYVSRGTPGAKLYTCYGLKIPRLVVSSSHDILYAQTLKYVRSEPDVQRKIFNNKLPHSFVQMVNLPESRETIDLVVEFIKARK